MYYFYHFASNKNIGITSLDDLTELQTMYHLIGKLKVPEQHIFPKYSKCSSF